MGSKSILSIALGLAIAVPASAFAAGQLFPHAGPFPAGTGARQAPPPAGPIKLKLGLTYENWGQPSAAVTANVPLALDNPSNVRCPVANGCHMIAEVAAELAVVNNAGSVGLCVYIDGNDANPGCNYIARVDPADGEVTLSNRLNYQMTAGIHTVQTFLVSQSGGTMFAYQADYALFSVK